MTIDISVVIPTYNQNSTYLTEAIESALFQTYPREKYEILVVDDGSTKTPFDTILSKFRNNGVIYVRKKHGGTANTLNVGIRMMKGKYFKWLSSDDTLCERALETLIAKTDEKTIAYGDWFRMDENSRIRNMYREPTFQDKVQMKRFIWHRFFANGTTTLIPKSAFDRVGLFDEDLPYILDYDWWLRAILLYDYQFVHVGKVIAKYRVHAGQISSRWLSITEKSLSEWRMKRRIYPLLDAASQTLLSNPSYTSLTRQMFSERISRLYRLVFGRPPIRALRRLRHTLINR